MRATLRRPGGLPHDWPAADYVEQTADGVVVDGHLVDGARLEEVTADA